jgi:transposase
LGRLAPVLEPGLGRTRTGRLWAYVRDDRPFCGPAPPAAVYFYSPDRGGEYPAAHLAHFTGFLQSDAYSGFGVRVPVERDHGFRWKMITQSGAT